MRKFVWSISLVMHPWFSLMKVFCTHKSSLACNGFLRLIYIYIYMVTHGCLSFICPQWVVRQLFAVTCGAAGTAGLQQQMACNLWIMAAVCWACSKRARLKKMTQMSSWYILLLLSVLNSEICVVFFTLKSFA